MVLPSASLRAFECGSLTDGGEALRNELYGWTESGAVGSYGWNASTSSYGLSEETSTWFVGANDLDVLGWDTNNDGKFTSADDYVAVQYHWANNTTLYNGMYGGEHVAGIVYGGGYLASILQVRYMVEPVCFMVA